MKLKLLLFIAVSAFSISGYGQVKSAPGNEDRHAATPGSEKHATTENVFYKDNIIKHFKDYTGDDLFLNYPDFPRFIDTGNLDQDVKQYQERAYAWIKMHPDFAKKYKLNIE